MQEMITKSVDVLGDAIMATKDADGIIWAGVSYFCKALGMNKGQKDRQTTNVQKDETLKRGCRKFAAGVFDSANEAVGMRIDFIPLWLAKINITKTMLTEHPDLADKLLDYQLKAKDILAEAFLPKQEPPTSVAGQIQLLAQGNVELNKRVDEVTEEVKSVREDLAKFKADVPAFNADTKDIQNALRKKAIEVLGGRESIAYNDNSVRGYAFADIQIELRRQFGIKRYDQIKHKDVAVALKIIEEYKPPIHIKDKIEMANAQQNLNLKGGEYHEN